MRHGATRRLPGVRLDPRTTHQITTQVCSSSRNLIGTIMATTVKAPAVPRPVLETEDDDAPRLDGHRWHLQLAEFPDLAPQGGPADQRGGVRPAPTRLRPCGGSSHRSRACRASGAARGKRATRGSSSTVSLSIGWTARFASAGDASVPSMTSERGCSRNFPLGFQARGRSGPETGQAAW